MDIRQLFNQLHSIPEEAWQAFAPLLEPVSLEKNEYLASEGDRVFYCYFLQEGVIRVFYSNDGTDYNKTFFLSGSFPTPITALLTANPSLLSYQALTDCSLERFSYTRFRSLFNEFRCFESLMLAIMEREWIVKERHEIRMVTLDATQNYLIFRDEHPGLENLIPQYHIASYLGITPIQLSRIRARLAR